MWITDAKKTDRKRQTMKEKKRLKSQVEDG